MLGKDDLMVKVKYADTRHRRRERCVTDIPPETVEEKRNGEKFERELGRRERNANHKYCINNKKNVFFKTQH